MTKLAFGITWDYRCPFASKAHEHVVLALRGGADWDVTFVPFSLGQVHVADGEPDIWDRPDDDSGLLALQAGVAVRDRFPERFLDVHLGLFMARHRHGLALRDPAVIEKVLADAGVDADAVFADIESGRPLRQIRTEHERAAADQDVWGVPTLIAGDEAAFFRIMHGADGDADASQRMIERLLGMLVCWPDLNEFKHTSIPR